MIKDYLKQFSWLGGSQIFSIILGLATSMFLARGLGPEMRGTYALVILLPMTVRSLIGLSLSSGVIYYTAKKEADIKTIISTSWYLQIILLFLELIITLFIAYFFGHLIIPGIKFSWVALATITLFIPALIAGQNQAILHGTQKFIWLGKVTMLNAFLIPFFYGILFFTKSFSINNILLVTFIANLPLPIVASIYVYKKHGLTKVDTKNVGWPMIKYGLMCHASNIITFFNYRLDQYLLNIFSTKTQVGFYGNSVTFAERLWLVSKVASTIHLPKIAADSEEQKRRKLTLYVTAVIFALSFAGAVFLWLVAPFIIRILWGEAFMPAVPIFRWLLPGIVILAAGRIIANDLAGRGKPQYNIICTAVALISNIITNIILIPKYGGIGAAIATSFSYTLATLLFFIFYVLELKKQDKTQDV